MQTINRFWLICIFALAGSTALVPTEAVAMSDKKAAKIGKEMREEVVAKTPIYQDKKVTDYISTIGQRLVKHSNEPDKKFSFTVLDDPQINAFATPGGYIYINRGLITYMNSEAELASVLAHEIAHLTENHPSRQQNANIGNSVAAGVLAILTRSSEVGEATAMWGTVALRGYGREMELEADAVGAKTLNRAGYPGDAVIQMLSQMKAHERFTKVRAKDAGKKPPTYHGLFSTHPRTDKRLLEIVKQAGKDNATSQQNTGVVPFRVATEGLAFGVNYRGRAQQDNRFYDAAKTFTFDYPEGWQFKQTGSKITGHSEDKTATLVIDIQARTKHSPDEYIKKVLKVPFIKKSEALTVARLEGHTGIISEGKASKANAAADTRLAILQYGFRVFVFTGQHVDGDLDDKHEAQISSDTTSRTVSTTYDDELQTIITSFRPSSAGNGADRQMALHYVKARENTTYKKLAAQLRLGAYGEEQLRLINGHYPSGKPKAGQWIKILR